MVPPRSEATVMSEARLDLLEKDVHAHAKSLSEIVIRVGDLIKGVGSLDATVDRLVVDKAVREETDKNLKDRLDRIEARIKEHNDGVKDQIKLMNDKLGSLKSVAWWTFSVFVGALLVAFANFIVRGGLAP